MGNLLSVLWFPGFPPGFPTVYFFADGFYGQSGQQSLRYLNFLKVFRLGPWGLPILTVLPKARNHLANPGSQIGNPLNRLSVYSSNMRVKTRVYRQSRAPRARRRVE
jgi:hypothetical protein